MRGWPSVVCVAVCAAAVACDAPAASGDGGVDAAAVACREDSECDDGRFCNGVEACSAGDERADARGCVGGADPCEPTQMCDEDADACVTDGCEEPDGDADGDDRIACGGSDCDDDDPDVFSGAIEVCDAAGRDEDCDPSTLGSNADSDSDGFASVSCCNEQDDGTLLCGADCDDMSMGVNPGTPESCNGVDDDCDGQVDEAVQLLFYRDVDGDGYGLDSATVQGCSAPDGYAVNGGDCDDTTRAISPVATEVCDIEDVDEDCDPSTVGSTDADRDRDGHLDAACCNVREDGTRSCGTDCDDDVATVYEGAPEICDGLDSDCSEGGGPSAVEDVDGDGTYEQGACVGEGPWDCDDTRDDLAPGLPDYPNLYCSERIDADCDGRVDEDPPPVGGGGCGTRPPGGYTCPAPRDCDGDGDGICAAPEGGDCDDGDPSVSPAWDEVCDGADDDCDGAVDEGACPSDCTLVDRDGRLYLFCDRALSWEDAQAACLELGRTAPGCGNEGGVYMRLARIESADEDAWLRSTGDGLGMTGDVWTAARDDYGCCIQPEGTWRWDSFGPEFWNGDANGSPVGAVYSNWAAGEPDDASDADCGVVTASGAWADRPCTLAAPFVCEGYRQCSGGCAGVTALEWATTATALECRDGEDFGFSCPSGGVARRVAGSGPYTSDSSICTAAVHAGAIGLDGGEVTVRMRIGAESHPGSSRNGVVSESVGAWPCSFSVWAR